MTYTYVAMIVTEGTFREIKEKLVAAEYHSQIRDDGQTLDMHGIALVSEPAREFPAGVLEVGDDGVNVVVNHPDLKPDENGVGHIVFSVSQARHFAGLILERANQLEQKGN
jgi:hypothetical protein